jgi:uncharacterized protein (DUF1778 family)
MDSGEERAERVLARADATALTEAEFNAVMASLDGAGWDLPKLARAAGEPRPYTRLGVDLSDTRAWRGGQAPGR